MKRVLSCVCEGTLFLRCVTAAAFPRRSGGCGSSAILLIDTSTNRKVGVRKTKAGSLHCEPAFAVRKSQVLFSIRYRKKLLSQFNQPAYNGHVGYGDFAGFGVVTFLYLRLFQLCFCIGLLRGSEAGVQVDKNKSRKAKNCNGKKMRLW